LTEHLIDQRGLAVIDVSDNGDIAEVRTFHLWVQLWDRGAANALFSSHLGQFDTDSLL
jgi:hypothetical protein